MNSEKLKNQNSIGQQEKLPPDPVEVRKAKNVIQFFRKTYSLIKIYPSENPSVKKSVDS